MAGAAPVEGGRKSRSLDATINLVPCIDLLSSLIAFLLMTAVWTQMGTLQVQGSGGGDGKGATTTPVRVLVGEQGLSLDVDGQVTPMAGGTELSAFTALGAAIQQTDAARGVHVLAEDGVAYDVVVRVLDACAAVGREGVMLSGAD